MELSNADCEQETQTRMSISDYSFLCDWLLISWRSKQPTWVGQNWKEVEFETLAFVIWEVLYLNNSKYLFNKVFDDSTVERLFKLRISEDNMGWNLDSHTLLVSERSKHEEIKYRFLVDNFLRSTVKCIMIQPVQWLPTSWLIILSVLDSSRWRISRKWNGQLLVKSWLCMYVIATKMLFKGRIGWPYNWYMNLDFCGGWALG